jgi:hypothetical protein
MMKNISPLSFLLLLSISCTAPRVVTKIIPEAPEGHYAMGREYIPLGSDHIGVELGYDGIQGENLVFDFVVHNASVDTLFILPDDFYYVVLDSANSIAAPHTPWMAVHPDKVLIHYDNTLEETKEAKNLNSLFGILQAGVSILYNTAGFIATENPAYIADAVFQTVGTADEYISQDKIISSEMEMISEEKQLVKEEIFRSCSVLPGTVTSGYVYFPLHEQTAYYMFCFPVGNQLFQFVYKQQKELIY